MKQLSRTFYLRDPRLVASDLIGKLLVRESPEGRLIGRIVETEAYLGIFDEAAHAYNGRTPRTEVLFGPAGHAYVYFIYGMYFCLNVSCLPPGDAGCVLIRAFEPVEGIASMAANRCLELPPDVPLSDLKASTLKKLSSGPSRLAAAMAITRPRDNGKDFTSKDSDLWIGEDRSPAPQVITSTRIGIKKAIEQPFRFSAKDNPFVSGKKF